MNIHLLKAGSLFKIILILLLLCIGLYIVPFSIMGSNLEFIPGDIGDATLNNYFLEHGFQWLSGTQKSFWNAPFFYPEPNVMTFSDNFLGTLPIYSAFRFSGIDRETSFQWWIITIFILNYISCLWVLRKFSINLIGSVAGAYIFTFSLPVMASLGHVQLLPRFMVPLAFYFTWSYLNKPNLKSLTGLCLSIVWQLYCAIYTGYFLVLAIAAFIISSAALNLKHYNWNEIFWGSFSKFVYRATIISASGLILLPLLLPYYNHSLEYGLREWSQISPNLPRIESLVIAVAGSFLWRNWLGLGNDLPAEHDIFIGILPWFAVAAVLFDIRKKAVSDIGRPVALSVLLVILMVLYWNGFSFYKYISLIPGVKAIRFVTRIISVLSFLFAVSVGVLFTKLENHKNKQSSAMLLSVFSFMLLCILVADQYVLPDKQQRYSKSAIQSSSRKVANEVLKKDPSAKIFAYMPKDRLTNYILHMYAMLASQSIHIPTINGYSGSTPRNYEFFSSNYDKPWALKHWMAFITEKYRTHYNSNDNLFDGLVIVGGPEDYVNNIEDDLNNLRISIANGPLPDEGFKAEISPDLDKITVKTSTTVLPVKITNKSGLTWAALGAFDGKNQIRLSYRWLSLNGDEIEGFNTRFPLHYDLLPGESMTLEVEIKAPSIPGIYIAEFDLVQEHVSWFANKGSKTARVEIKVE